MPGVSDTERFRVIYDAHHAAICAYFARRVARDEVEDLGLSWTQRRERRAGPAFRRSSHDLPSDAAVQDRVPLGQCMDRADDRALRSTLQDVASCAGAQCPVDRGRVVMHREHEHRDIRARCQQLAGGGGELGVADLGRAAAGFIRIRSDLLTGMTLVVMAAVLGPAA